MAKWTNLVPGTYHWWVKQTDEFGTEIILGSGTEILEEGDNYNCVTVQ